ncbi:hypothetical protein [Actinokineospora sp.]|uniref:hypothetical protein n=1 Tax=Actinokineospora sp. TaxID=1872133 RepID=UPI0040381831
MPEVIVVGAGIVGASVAYHLAEACWVTHAGGAGRLLAARILDTGEYSVDPDRLCPNRFEDWDADRISAAALRHYRGIYDTH